MHITGPELSKSATPSRHKRRSTVRAVLGLAIATGSIAVLAALESLTGVAAVVAIGVVGFVFVVAESRLAPVASADLDIHGLARVIDARRRDGVFVAPVAAVMLELRGIAADTVVDGAAAWSEPVAVVARRLACADIGEDLVVARIAPHTFGAVVSVSNIEAAVAAAESLVALCRVPVRTPAREIRIDAVAGVSHAEAGEICSGEELLRAADASLRVDGTVAAPVAARDGRLLRHARRVIEVETEIRYSLDVDLLTARLIPVVDVQNDRIAGLRSAYDWSAVSSTDPEILRSIAASLGLRRSIETQYLMRSIAAAESLPSRSRRPVVARIGADRLTDRRAINQIGLLVRASGIDPANLVFELDCWGANTLGLDAYERLGALGVGVGLTIRHHDDWEKIPSHFVGRLDAVSVAAADLAECDGTETSALRISRLQRILDDDLSRVTVVGVDSAAVALELSAAGLTTQCGSVHGRPMAAADLKDWLEERSNI